MAKCVLNIEAEDIKDLMDTLRRGADMLMKDGMIVEVTGDPGLVENDRLIEKALGEPAKRTRRTKAEMEADKQPVHVEEPEERHLPKEEREAKANGEATYTLADVRTAANEALSRAGGKGEAIKAALQETFGTNLFSKLTEDQFGPAIEMLKGM